MSSDSELHYSFTKMISVASVLIFAKSPETAAIHLCGIHLGSHEAWLA